MKRLMTKPRGPRENPLSLPCAQEIEQASPERRLGSTLKQTHSQTRKPAQPIAPVGTLTTTLVAMLLAGLLTPRIHAQSKAPAGPITGQATEAIDVTPPKAAARLDYSHCRGAFSRAQRWVEAGEIDPTKPLRPIWVSSATGVRVTLRWAGVTVGRGQASIDFKQLPGLTGSPKKANPTSKPVNLASLTRFATYRALRETEAWIKSRQARVKAAIPEDKRLTIQKLGPKLLIDIQFAKALEPIRVPQGSSLYYQFAPGFHGLCLGRLGPDRQVLAARVWPATALATNASPQAQVKQLLRQVSYDERSFPLLGRLGTDGIPIARFEVIHLTQPGRGQPVTQLTRGNRVIPPGPVTGRTLSAMGDRLANHMKRRQKANGDIVGGYEPTSDALDPKVAPLSDLALATYALGLRSAYLEKMLPDDERFIDAKQFTRKAVSRLIDQLVRGKDRKRDPAAMALLLMTLIDTPHLTELKADRDAIGMALDALIQEDGTFRQVPVRVPSARPAPPSTEQPGKTGGKTGKENAPPTPQKPLTRMVTLNFTFRALIVNALTSLYEQTRDTGLKKSIDNARDQLWKELNVKELGQRLSALPWLVAMEKRMHRLSDGKDPAWAKRSKVIAETVVQLRKLQIKLPPESGPADVIGGFVRDDQQALSGAIPNPDWLTANVLVVMVDAMDEPSLRGGVHPVEWLLDCGLAARFIAQLMMDEPNCFYVRNVPDSLGGVRLALWNNKLGAAPSAMSLIAITRLQLALLNK